MAKPSPDVAAGRSRSGRRADAGRRSDRLAALWAFARPHTIVGTTISLAGLLAIAYADVGAPGRVHAVALSMAWLSALAANVFIVGLNQITDVAIDRVNKPALPLPAGELSSRQARRIVAVAAVTSLVAAAAVSPILLATVSTSMAIGAAYSLPPLRLKRHAFWAAASISAVRGVLVNVGLYATFRQILGAEIAIPPAVWTLAGFVAAFSVAIAIGKDIPDVAGDRAHAIGSVAVRLGPARALAAVRAILATAYVAVIAVGLAGLPGVHGPTLAAGHGLLLLALWLGTRRTDPHSRASVRDAYALIWRLFYAEYLVFPVACLVAAGWS